MTEPSPSTPPAEEAKSLSWVFRFILITSALYIAGCSAFFSVRGLGLLFVGSDTEVMIMAASLEVGKLVAASFLYRYWDRINSVLRFYLTLAVLILIGITSLGNYGYLARAYEKTTTQINRNELEIATLEKEIADIQHQLDESQGKNNRLNSASREDLSKAQLRLTQATASLEQSLTRLQEQRKAVNERRTQDLAAPTQRATEQSSTIAKSIAAEEAASAKAIAAEETVIAGLNERLKVLDAAVAAYTAQGTSTQYLFFEKDNVKKGQELRDEQRPERDQIAVALANASARIDRGRSEANRRIEQLRTEQSRINESANKDVAQLRQQFASDLAKLDSEEKELRKAGAATIADLEKQIAALQEHDQGKVTMTEAEIETLHKQIHDRNQQIHVLRDAIAGSDIGSYRFVARAFEAEADDVVKWLMLALVSVFDPLAVTLVVAFNMATTRAKNRQEQILSSPSSTAEATPAKLKPRTGWSAWEISVVVILTSIIALIVAWLWISERSSQAARSNVGTSNIIPGDSFAVLTFRPDELRQKGNHAFPEWLERTGGKGMSAAVAELLKNGLDPHTELYAFAKFPSTANQKMGVDPAHPTMLCGLVIHVTDPVAAEAALSRIADQINNTLRGETGKPTSNLTRSRSMIRYGEGRYMDPEGGFFTFGLTNRTAIILVEFEGNPAAPCVENEIRSCLNYARSKYRNGELTKDKIPAYAKEQPGALTFWLDANRFFRRLPMSNATRARYEKLEPSLDFELLMALNTKGTDALVLNASYIYQFDRFHEGIAIDSLKNLPKMETPAKPDLGWKLMNRCLDTLDYETMIEHMRGALSEGKGPGAQQVLVEKTINSPRDAKFTMNTRFDAKAGPPIISAMQILSQ